MSLSLVRRFQDYGAWRQNVATRIGDFRAWLDKNELSDGQTDLRLTFMSTDERWTVEVFGENLEDEMLSQRTQTGGDGLQQANWGMPTNYGARVKIRF